MEKGTIASIFHPVEEAPIDIIQKDRIDTLVLWL